jgi:enoyl-CoA hydratase/carnithine racemase
VHLVFDIFQGMGVAAAVGLRPFLPALAVGALGAADVELHFKHTHFAFLGSVPFLIGMVVGVIACTFLERALGQEKVKERPFTLVLPAFGLALGALLFAGTLCRGGHATWPGLIGGVVCAGIAIAATAPLLIRVRSRLDEAAARALPVLVDGAALLIAVLSVVAPPIGLITVVLLLWLVYAGRGRDQQKYAGLRILGK